MSYTQAHLCAHGRGGLSHVWDVIPVEYEPNCSVWDYIEILNLRCTRCGKVKALLYDASGDYIPRYKGGTGVVYSDGEVRPDRDDLRAMLFARVASIEERNARRTATRSTAPSQRTRTKTAETKGKQLAAVA